MLVVDPSSTCDICLEPYDWDNAQRTPHLIGCGHIFCEECLRQVFPTKCPLCRKVYLPSEVQKLHVECPSDVQKEEMALLRDLILAYDSTEEEILRLRIRVDAWLAARVFDEQSPLLKAREALEQYQQLKQKRIQDRRKIKTLERSARQWEKAVQDSSTRKEAEAAIMEQALRSQLAEHQAQIAQLRAEIAKRQAEHARHAKKKALPKQPLPASNPLPEPPRMLPVPPWKPQMTTAWSAPGRTETDSSNAQYNTTRLHLVLHEKDDELDEDNLAFYTCRSAPYAWLDDDDISREPLLQRPEGHYH